LCFSHPNLHTIKAACDEPNWQKTSRTYRSLQKYAKVKRKHKALTSKHRSKNCRLQNEDSCTTRRSPIPPTLSACERGFLNFHCFSAQIRRPHRGQQAVRVPPAPPSVPPAWDSGGPGTPPPRGFPPPVIPIRRLGWQFCLPKRPLRDDFLAKHNFVYPKGPCGTLFQFKMQFYPPKKPLRDDLLLFPKRNIWHWDQNSFAAVKWP